MEEITRHENESLDEYLIRLYEHKDDYNLTSVSICDLMNAASGEEYNESKWRKDYAAYVKWKTYLRDHGDANTKQLANSIKVERVRLRDERTEYNALLRNSARFDDFLNALATEWREHGESAYPALEHHYTDCNDGTVLVCLSDLHYGLMINSTTNEYSPEIAALRLRAYADRIKATANSGGYRKCVIALMGDLINGAIHITGRLSNRENVVQQVVGVAELLTEFVYDLSNTFDSVSILNVPGNHSRISKKEDALNGERLDMLVPWYIEAVLYHLDNVIVEDGVAPAESKHSYDTYTERNIEGHAFWFVHGDYDEFSEAGVYKLAAWRHSGVPYAVVFGHMHQTRFVDGNIKLMQSGCLSGNNDEFTTQKRLGGVASQLMCVITKDGLTDFIPVELNNIN